MIFIALLPPSRILFPRPHFIRCAPNHFHRETRFAGHAKAQPFIQPDQALRLQTPKKSQKTEADKQPAISNDETHEACPSLLNTGRLVVLLARKRLDDFIETSIICYYRIVARYFNG